MNNHPITPPRELTDKWNNLPLSTEEIFVIAAQWGADQELEACCTQLKKMGYIFTQDLRNARRPKLLSDKEQALKQLDEISNCFRVSHGGPIVCDKIRKALESL